MTRIPFIEARFFNPKETRNHIEKRFTAFLRALREAKGQRSDEGQEDSDADPEALVSIQDMRRISLRTGLLLTCP